MSHVGDVKGLILLDKDGKRIISKYYSLPSQAMQQPLNQKYFERKLFLKSSKYSSAKGIDVDILHHENFVVLYKGFTDLNIYVLGGQNDNELVLSELLSVLVECFGIVFKHSFGRQSVIQYMSQVILIVDEMIEDGLILSLDADQILRKIHYFSESQSKANSQKVSFLDAFKTAKEQIAKNFF